VSRLNKNKDVMTAEEATENANSPKTADHQPARSLFVRRLIRTAWSILCIAVVAGFVCFGIYLTTQSEPQFYSQVMLRSAEELESAGDEFETKLISLQNQIQQSNRWATVLDENQINGWLAVDCTSKFPELIPHRASQPRVQIKASEIVLAFRFQSRRISAIITVAADIFVEEESGDIAIRLKSAKSGIIPLPIAAFADRITQHLRKSGIGVVWTQLEHDPVALMTIPEDKLKVGDQTIQFESILCREGRLELVGTSLDDGVETD
jgi:hypothetical protein